MKPNYCENIYCALRRNEEVCARAMTIKGFDMDRCKARQKFAEDMCPPEPTDDLSQGVGLSEQDFWEDIC